VRTYCPVVLAALLVALALPAAAGVLIPAGEPEVTNAIAGTVRNGAGVGIANVTVTLYQGESVKATTTTYTNGRYYFLELAAGTYTVRPSYGAMAFSPTHRAVTVPTGNLYADFTGGDATGTISGTVKNSSGAALAGVTVALCLGDAQLTTTTTNAEGRYTFSHVEAGTYYVRPISSTLVFDPVRRSVTIPAGTTAANFVAVEGTGTISGLVKTASGVARAEVTVKLYLGDMLYATTTTNAEGRYTFSPLPPGTYSVRPSGTALTFDPTSRFVTVPPGTTSADFTVGYVIAGNIKTASGAGVSGVTVGLYVGDTLKTTATTNGAGRYYLLNLDAGKYTVKPSLSGKVFSPAYRSVTVPPSNTATDFTAAEQTGPISGTIKTGAGAPLSGVTVTLYVGDTQKATTTTNAEGRYTFEAVVPGTYSVRPSGAGMTFDPAYKLVTVLPGTTSANFVGGYVIAGTIKTAAGTAIANVSVGLYVGDTLKTTTTTNSKGRYYFVTLGVGNYTVKPVLSGKVFSPTQRAVSAPPGNTAADFTGAEQTGTVSGVIKTASGVAVSGLTVYLYLGDTRQTSTVTNAEGRYTFSGLVAGTYSVRPSGTMTFDPAQRLVTVPPGTTTADFTAGYVIAGTIKTVGGTAVANVSVGLYVGDTLKATTTTNTSGRYYFLGLDVGNYTVKPTQTGVTFSPVSRAVVVPLGSTAADFTAASVTYTISGVIKTVGGVACANVNVALYQGDTLKGTVTTNSEGRYTFTGVIAGNYTVRPSYSGVTFDPTYRAVTVGPGTTTANFTAKSV
jgi:protocatechuate 3,4-dioxygenase beta subunit